MIKLNLQLFGGRGASSSASGSAGGSTIGVGGKTLEYYLEGKGVEGTPGDARKQATEFLASAQNVFDDFNMDGFTRVTFNETGALFGKANASVNGFNQVTINTNMLTRPEKNSKGYFVSDTIAGTGAHEAGHAVMNELYQKKVMPGATNLQIATARQNGKLEKAIIKESKKRYGSNPVISRYGSTKPSEKVAEAFSDVYTNGKRANPYSQTIVNVARDINDGNFDPKLRY